MSGHADWQYPDSRLLVFADAPVAGRVNAPLAGVMGAEQAARAYSDWLGSFVARLAGARLAPLQLWITPDDRHPLFARLRKSAGIELYVQPRGDRRISRQQVVQRTLEQCESAVLLGADCPVMQPDYVRRALAVMKAGTGCVLGPATGGAWVLLGLRGRSPALPDGLPGDRPGTLSGLRRRLAALDGDWAELETLWRIEQPADYRRWLRCASDVTARPVPATPPGSRAFNNNG